jgi:PadR family transcriptional regulator PadR
MRCASVRDRFIPRLLLSEWVEAEWDITETNRKARYYKITPAGRKQLAAEMKSFDFLVAAIGRRAAVWQCRGGA